MSCVLVSGSTGFIGRHLAPALGRRRAVRAAARDQSRSRVPARAELAIIPDLAGPVDWRPLLAGASAVVHLAAIAHIGPQIPDATYDQVNAVATARLAAAARRAGVRRLVYISSIRAQSGPVSAHALTEADDPHPTDADGRSKLLGVDNLADVIEIVLATPATEGQTYVVADPQPITFRNIITSLRRGFGRRPGLYAVPPSVLGHVLRFLGKSEAWIRFRGELVVDPSKLIAAGWSPAAETAAALEQMARHSATA